MSAKRSAPEAMRWLEDAQRTVKVLSVLVAIYIVVVVTISSTISVITSYQALQQSRKNGDVADLIRQCVEPTPKGAKPSSCLTNADARQAQAVAAIVDSDANKVADGTEIKAALARIEALLTGR